MMEKINEILKNYKENLNFNITKDKKERMIEKFERYILIISHLEAKVKNLLDEYGVLNERFFYYSFLREIYSLFNKYKYKTLKKEIDISIEKWQRRGLKKYLLLKIKRIVNNNKREKIRG